MTRRRERPALAALVVATLFSVLFWWAIIWLIMWMVGRYWSWLT